MKMYPTLADSIFIGDRVVDVCGELGVYCKAMSTGIIPMIEEVYPFSHQMECTACIATAKRKLLYYTAKKMNVNHIVLEKSGGHLDPADMADELREQGYQIDIVDFTHSVSEAVRQAGELYDRQKLADKVIKRYESSMETALAGLPKDLDKRVLVLMGMSNFEVGAEYLLAEQSGGDVDEYILKPTGCTTVGEHVRGEGSTGLGFTVIDDLEKLGDANPDFIAFLCDSYIPQKAVHKALKANPELADVPAIRDRAFFSLPHCSSGAPLKIPDGIIRWSDALRSA